MADFLYPVDIANRALQHCGSARIVAFTDDTKAASAVLFCYDKLRKAELRRNVWRFAIRKAVLRPIATTTTLLTPVAYSAVTAYAVGAVVLQSGKYWEATAATTGAAPEATDAPWEHYAGPLTIEPYDATISWNSGELVLSGGVVYRSLISGNADVPPTANWLSLGAASGPLSILYPLGAGPTSQTTTRNVFRLPNGFLRQAPQDPKAGSSSALGAPSGLNYEDWNLEGNYLVSSDVEPILYRFVANISLVPSMDAMFCEGLAARIGLEVCEELTQSAEKLQTIGTAYNKFMGEARQVNGIETGSTEPPEDDYITCRV